MGLAQLVAVALALAAGSHAATCLQEGHACTGTFIDDVSLPNKETCINMCRQTVGCGCVTWMKKQDKKCRLMAGTAVEDRARTDLYGAQLMSSRCFFTDKIGAEQWSPCSHTSCKVEDHDCTHAVYGSARWHPFQWTKDSEDRGMLGHMTFPRVQTPTLGAPHDHDFHHARTPKCRHSTSLRVYHHAQEQKGTVHRCGVHGASGCVCECALKESADTWNLLGDSASGLYAPTTSTCPERAALVPSKRCGTRELTGTNNNPAIDTADYTACRAACGKMGAGCVEFQPADGLCRCYDMHHPLARGQRPVADDAGAASGVLTGVCTDDHARVDRALAVKYYTKASAMGSAYADKRLADIARVEGRGGVLAGHHGKLEHHTGHNDHPHERKTNKWQDYDKLCAQADRNAIAAPTTSSEHCQCRKHFWRVMMQDIVMAKCTLCPWHSHVIYGLKGTLSCECDEGYKAVVEGTDIKCVEAPGASFRNKRPADLPVLPWQADLPWRGSLSGKKLLDRFAELGHATHV